MVKTKCPFCQTSVNMNAVEVDDGCCPECGALMTSTSIFAPQDDEELYDEEFDSDDLDDDLDGESKEFKKLIELDEELGEDYDFDGEFDDEEDDEDLS